ncbi:MAG: PatB family C-S lyase [Paracoccaceae bacterium]|nr:PatB family C-S lyase [Paracoccaceae bacterium]
MVELTAPPRRGTDCNKWKRYPEDVIPLWVADMDYAVDPAIIEAVCRRLEHPVLGYGSATDVMRLRLVEAIKRDYDWQIAPDWLIFIPGVEPGFNMALHAFTTQGQTLLQEVPVYKPLRTCSTNWGLNHTAVPQIISNGRWETDTEVLKTAARGASVHILCNPQNPTGRVYTRSELEARAAMCLRENLILISDEIHCGLTLDGRAHIPIASLSPEIAARSVTLMAASKTWNIAGLKAAFAIVPDAAMREKMMAARLGMVDSVNVIGLTAMDAAYSCLEWRKTARRQIAKMRDMLTDELARKIPRARMIPPEGSFLAWIDFTGCDLPSHAATFFLQHARVALSCGTEFDEDLGHHARLNYGCTTQVLAEALDRMAIAVAQNSQTGKAQAGPGR